MAAAGSSPLMMLDKEFYNLAQNKAVNLGPVAEDSGGMLSLVGSSHGWQALFNMRNGCLFLWNPVSHQRINLPSLGTLPMPIDNMKDGSGVSKVIVSSPPYEADCRALMSFGPVRLLAFCCPGSSTKWTPMGDWYHHEEGRRRIARARIYRDYSYSRGLRRFFCITNDGDLERWDLRDPQHPKLEGCTEGILYGNDDENDNDNEVEEEEDGDGNDEVEEEGDGDEVEKQGDGDVDEVEEEEDGDEFYYDQEYEEDFNYLVAAEHSNEVFLVSRTALDRRSLRSVQIKFRDNKLKKNDSIDLEYAYKTINFNIFRIVGADNDDGDNMSLHYVEESLDDLVMFVGGLSHSFAVPASEFPCLKPDSVYFTDPMDISCFTGDIFGLDCNDVGIFDYRNKTFHGCYKYPSRAGAAQDIVVSLSPIPVWFTPTSTPAEMVDKESVEALQEMLELQVLKEKVMVEKEADMVLQQLPTEMVEEILLNLPVKSLLRFSSISKAWNSTISESGFMKRYRIHASLPGRERESFALKSEHGLLFPTTYHVCPISSISSGVGATEFLFNPFGESSQLFITAFCDDMWLACPVEENKVTELLYLWNPSMRRYKKISNTSSYNDIDSFACGLGYDSLDDDYKILKIPKLGEHECAYLYSMRSDSWREIQIFPKEKFESYECCPDCALVNVSGNLHWLTSTVIFSFDISTEKFGEMALPPIQKEKYGKLAVPSILSALSGMLCVTLNYCHNSIKLEDQKCVIWVMEEYGVATSWSNKFSIACYHPGIVYVRDIQPLYLYQNGELLIRGALGNKGITKLFVVVSKDEKTRLQELTHNDMDNIGDGVVYAHSLIPPAMWSNLTRVTEVDGSDGAGEE